MWLRQSWEVLLFTLQLCSQAMVHSPVPFPLHWEWWWWHRCDCPRGATGSCLGLCDAGDPNVTVSHLAVTHWGLPHHSMPQL